MSFSKRILIFIGILSVFFACSSMRVTYQYDKSRVFQNYKDYAWLTENVVIDVEDGLMRLKLPGNELVSYVDRGMKKKGFMINPFDPQFLVLVHMGLKENVTVKDKGGSKYGKGKMKIEVESHPEGSVFLDVIDAESFNLVWRGTAIKETEDKPTEKTMKKNISKAIDELLAGFPPES